MLAHSAALTGGTVGMAIRIVCISKDSGHHENPYVAISRLGWVSDETGEQKWSTRLQVYEWLERGGHAYVQVGNSKAKLITAISPRNTKYVRTEADHTRADNLLGLPECG